ncbi:GAF domain-containing protein [Hymenobacter sp. HMF4947]|uniref:GAF domain-containing protein n=1 Tax=Hymenobacter ginkgonis TaxID=2682976 RepID=A0A7K1TH85_9BACT|nr:GAF domain-containing protein [Hymenobacter ginkgonis]MVN77775.1 GAF domain-containing protein [Hymenobacter ginkgonis]
MENPTPLPLAEARRLQALRPYQLFNTMRDETFAELVRLTAKLFNVPIGIIAFVEENEVRFGLNYGLDPAMDRVNRWQTLCSVAMLNQETSVFENLHDQPCDLINPTLVHELSLGFYAGSALRTHDGYPIGVLCVIDQKPRSFSSAEAAILERLAAVVMSLLDLRLHLQQQPTWNQQLWERIYTRIDTSVTRLETLAALANWEEQEDSPAALAYQQSTQEEILRVIAVLTEQIQAQVV